VSAVDHARSTLDQDDEALICNHLRAVTAQQIGLIDLFLHARLETPVRLAEMLEDIGNEFLRYADGIARQRRDENHGRICDA